MPRVRETGTAVAGNRLEVGQPRLGWMIDGDPATPEVSTTLVDDGSSIVLTVPWNDSGSLYGRWFAQGMMFGDDPDRRRFRYEVPEILWFRDHSGSVTLVGCRSIGSNSNFIVGQGRASVRIAVMGGQRLPDYRKINGLRTDLPGLGDWMTLRSLSYSNKNDANGRLESLHLDLKAPDPVPLTRAMNLRIRPNFSLRIPSTPEATLIEESLQIESLVQRPREWEEHLRAHETVRELLSLSAWRSFGYSALWAHLETDPERVLSGDAVGRRWAEVATHAVRKHTPSTTRPHFLFTYEGIKSIGVRRWFRLRDSFGRGIGPILSTLDAGHATIEGAMSQVAIGLDGIGYQLALDSGLSPKQANNESHEVRLLRVVGELTVPLPPPFSVTTWAGNAAVVYNGLKHANRAFPDLLLTINTLRESQLVFRLWVAARVGAPKDQLQQRLSMDSMIFPYELA